ncbi:MAG: class I SAM-dependent methyltransferase [Mycoplasmatota bacterium]
MSYYFSNDENLKSEEKQYDTMINGIKFSFITDNGVFSKNKLDFGTRSLLENIDDIKGDVLDIGCGYGPIGIYIAKKFNLIPDMIDINKRGLKLAKKNAELNKVEVNIFESDIYEAVKKRYDFIISNPPIRVGKRVLYQLLFEAKNHLKENGQLIIVINKDQGAKSLIKDLEKDYKIASINKNKGFFVICAVNNFQ